MKSPHAAPTPQATAAWTQNRPLREEIASALIQGCAAVVSCAGLARLVERAGPQRDALELAALLVYGAALCIAFLSSALYHGVQQPRLRARLQRIDHCTIFLLIAGTYTPVALLPLRQHGGAFLLVAVWILALGGIGMRLANEALFHRIALPCYLLLGWLGLAWGPALYRSAATLPLVLMLAGALSYTGGLLFYRWHGQAYSNSLWHLCVVAGSAWFYGAISCFAAP